MSEVSESSKECLICRGSFDSRFVVHKDQSWTIRHSEETDYTAALKEAAVGFFRGGTLGR